MVQSCISHFTFLERVLFTSDKRSETKKRFTKKQKHLFKMFLLLLCLIKSLPGFTRALHKFPWCQLMVYGNPSGNIISQMDCGDPSFNVSKYLYLLGHFDFWWQLEEQNMKQPVWTSQLFPYLKKTSQVLTFGKDLVAI